MPSAGPVFTVIVEVAVSVPEVAVIVAVPGGLEMVAAALTRPALTVATAASDVVQSATAGQILLAAVIVSAGCCKLPGLGFDERYRGRRDGQGGERGIDEEAATTNPRASIKSVVSAAKAGVSV